MPTIKVPTSTTTYTFNYYEKYGSPQESCSGDVFRAKRTFDVGYEYRWLFIRHMLGTAEAWNNGKTIKRWIPDQYYVYYGPQQKNEKAFMVATTLEDVEVLGEQGEHEDSLPGSILKTATYKIARITIGYEAVTYDVLSDKEMGSNASEYDLRRFVTVFRQPTAEFLTLPQGAFRWVEFDEFSGLETKVAVQKVPLVVLDQSSPGTPIGLPVVGSNGKIVSAQEIILIHHRVPGIPKAMNTHIGCVNDKAWKGLRAERGQLLLSNIELKPYRWLDDQRLYDITFKFKFFDPDPVKTKEMVDAGRPERARGHNWFMQHFPNTAAKTATDFFFGKPTYKLITHNGFADTESNGQPSGRTVYQYADMSKLFTDYQVVENGQY